VKDLTSQNRSQIMHIDFKNPPAETLSIDVTVVYNAIDYNDIIRFSKLKNGSAKITREFGNDLAFRIKNDLGERIAAAPFEWGVVSMGSSQFLGEVTAKSLALPHAHIRLDDFSLFKVKNYDSAETFEERNNQFYSKHLTLEKRRCFNARYVILVDDMLNRGVSLVKGKAFLEWEKGMQVAGAYVLYSVAHEEDASLEARISEAFIDKEGIDALINMVNEEDIFVTRRLLRNLFSNKSLLRNMLALNPGKRLVLLSKGFVSLAAKVWVLMKTKKIRSCKMKGSLYHKFIDKPNISDSYVIKKS